LSVTRSIIFGGAALLGAFGSARALDPALHVSQYGHTSWRIQDGALPGTPTAIAQTRDGYVWIGTSLGLIRFDGAAFVPVTPPPDQKPVYPRVTSLYGGKDGSLWIGTPNNLMRWRAGQFHLYKSPIGTYAAVREAPDGKVWTTRYSTRDHLGPLCEILESGMNCYGADHGIPFKDAARLAIESSGAIWIATANKIARWEGNQSRIFAPSDLARNEGLEGFRAVAVAADGSIWTGVIDGGPGLGLQHYANEVWNPLISGAVNTSTWEVTALLFDRDNALWVGTANQGIYRISGNTIDHFGVNDGLSADSVNGFCEDHEGDIWVVTTTGIDKFRPMRVVTFASRQGLSADSANAVLATKSGALWVSNGSALDRIEDGVVTGYRERDGLPGKLPTALLEDSQRRLWIGVNDGVAVFENNHFTRVQSPGHAIGTIGEFALGPVSTVWGTTALLPSRLVRMDGETVVDSVQPPPGTRIYTLAADPDGVAWMTLDVENRTCSLARYAAGRWETFPLDTYPCGDIVVRDAHSVFTIWPGGIEEWHDGVVEKLTHENGLPCENPSSLIFDGQANLWVGLQCGIAIIEAKQLAAWSRDPTQRLTVSLLDASDGALPSKPDFHPRAAVAADGKVWFANSNVLQFVDPRNLLANAVVPPVQIQALYGDGRVFPLASQIALPARTRNIQIDFTALSFVLPQRVRFKYRLEGWDTDWQNIGGRRQAFYTDLRPGHYQFHVIAANNDGVWNKTGAALNIAVAPAFYQTPWFYAACALAAVATLWQLYQMRVRLLARQIRIRMGERLEERERIARELHDTLLQSTQGLLFIFRAFWMKLSEDDPMREKLGSALDRSNSVIAEARDRVRQLRSSDLLDGNLELAFAKAGKELSEGGAATFRALVKGVPQPLQPDASDDIYRIGREALQNAAAHSNARSIEIDIIYETDELQIRIRDDGNGIDPNVLSAGSRDGHFGLVGMRERAQRLGGRLEIWSKPGAGAEIALVVPAGVAYRRKEHVTRWKKMISGGLFRS
jgi:signal transduction histidine kinase/ligand-binding sensor domain-containing protein